MSERGNHMDTWGENIQAEETANGKTWNWGMPVQRRARRPLEYLPQGRGWRGWGGVRETTFVGPCMPA